MIRRREFIHLAGGLTPLLASGPPLRIGASKQLFFDDHVIESREGVTREMGRARKMNGARPVIEVTEPAEKPRDLGYYLTALRDGGRLRMWYWADRDSGIGYAESNDGFRWDKPHVGEGRTDNLIYRAHGIRRGQGFGCCYDPHETDPAHRYKSAFDCGSISNTRAGLAHSPDGIRWTDYNRGQPVTGRAADTHNQILWDEKAGLYRLSTRTDFGTAGGKGEVRGNRIMVNPDVKSNPGGWKPIREWKLDAGGESEAARRQINAVTYWLYEGVYFALLHVYEWMQFPFQGNVDFHRRHERDILNFYIAASRDGVNFDLRWVYQEKPLVPRGPDGTFDKDGICPPSQLVTWKDLHWIYYGGLNERHYCPDREMGIGLATVRLDGMIYLAADSSGGVVVTRPFLLEGERLEVNLDSHDGEAIVEVLDDAGNPAPGFTQRFRDLDEVHAQPDWGGQVQLGQLKGRPVRLRFRLRTAKLYSFRIFS